MQFSGMTFQRDAEDALTVFLAIRQKDGTVKEETFRYTEGRIAELHRNARIDA